MSKETPTTKETLTAKEKYQAVIGDAGRGDFVCRTNRIGATRYPSSGDCQAVNNVYGPQRRRSSAASGGGASRMRDRIRNMLNQPAC
ncbi:hypothetical protein GGS23DRAFT_230268 [Durotheca rogersii]|uniref:uncharacterized protein n=1 Tax=Durotheca rogersii TaxID=419775 RepID=UPI00221E4453|nr:uncharacterized protein GGS23DRAFT_230268 [Durotheca rogersii]KAI5860591.1 hypothetical protein GGS23DRAFT_230268 [Durotheca rogersii]